MSNRSWFVVVGIVILLCMTLALWKSSHNAERLDKLENEINRKKANIQHRKVQIRKRCDAVRADIGRGRLENAVAEIAALCQEVGPHLWNQALLLKGRVESFLSKDRRGILSNEEATLERNKLAESAMNLAQGIQKRC